MGWDTQISIIVENVINEQVEIAKDLFNTDAKSYYQNGVSFIKYREDDNGKIVLFYTYERRKYLPYWTIKEVSKKFNDQYFTVIASSPDFLCGPAGLVKIVKGDVVDSYGFTERFGDMQETIKALENPNPELLFQYFGKGKIEDTLREYYLDKQPRRWIDEKYADNILDYSKQEKEIFNTINIDPSNEWTEIKQPTTLYWE
jgi:hypothetical protein